MSPYIWRLITAILGEPLFLKNNIICGKKERAEIILINVNCLIDAERQ